MTEDFYTIALSRLRNFILPSAGEHGDVMLMAEAAKIEASLANAQQLKRIADVLEYVKDKGEALLEDKE